MNKTDCLRRLADEIVASKAVVIIGAGCSASITRGATRWKGLKLGSELLDTLKQSREYLESASDLSQACWLLRHSEGRPALESLLGREFDSRGVEPAPVYTKLAKLRIEHFVSFNFDELLEKAIGHSGEEFFRVVTDNDVAVIPSRSSIIVKPHGTVSIPQSMRIAVDEVFDFEEHSPIIDGLMKSILANRTALYLGFSLRDADFLRIIRYFKRHLGDHMPKGYAVMRGSDDYLKSFWHDNNITLIDSDLTEFVGELTNSVTSLRFQLEEDIEPWQKNPFFWELIEIRSLPTETQVIEALISEIERRLCDDASELSLVHKGAIEAVDLVLEYRRNFSALRALGEELDGMFKEGGNNLTKFWELFRDFQSGRELIRKNIAKSASVLLKDVSSVGLFSQSQRVVDLLAAADPGTQKRINIFIGECRPKSSESFQDAKSTAFLLEKTNYRFSLLPDMALLHKISTGECDLILLGAHAVYEDESGDYWGFVNTCGSKAIVQIAEKSGVRVGLVFERNKIFKLEKTAAARTVSFDEEESIGVETISELSRKPSLSDRTQVLNVGYDLVEWSDIVEAITD